MAPSRAPLIVKDLICRCKEWVTLEGLGRGAHGDELDGDCRAVFVRFSLGG